MNDRIRLDPGNRRGLAEELFQTEAQQAPTYVREINPGGPRFIQGDGSPATPEQIQAYYNGTARVVDTAPEAPKEPWER